MAEKDRSKVSLADFALRSKGAQEERFANTMKATESWAYGKIVDGEYLYCRDISSNN